MAEKSSPVMLTAQPATACCGGGGGGGGMGAWGEGEGEGSPGSLLRGRFLHSPVIATT